MSDKSTALIAEATRRQLQAADPQRSVWVSANAGSGKTRVLTNRVIRLLLDGTEPQRILCLTYTKAAAAEMAKRLFDQLGEWASVREIKLREEIEKLTGVSVTDVQLLNARRLFARALETPGGLKIQTIHAFCESLLGRFPLEAGIPSRFDVMDDRQGAELLEETLNTLLVDIAQAPDGMLARAFATMVAETSDDRITDLLNALAYRRSDLFRWIDQSGSRDAALKQVYDRFDLDPSVNVNDAGAQFFSELDGQRKERLREAADVLSGSKGKDDQKNAVYLQSVLNNDNEPVLDDWLSMFLTDKGTARSRGFVVKAIRDDHPDVAETMDREQERALHLKDHLRKVRIASNTAALLTLGFELAERFEARKVARGLLDFSDLIQHTRGLLERSDVAPWVMYKLDGGIDHILVDEAQDTSPDQWAVIKTLADEFFQGESARDLDRTIFAVGDEKQSIYSFQGAAPEEFAAMRAHFAQEAEEAQRQFEDISLNLSFRSREVVLETVDRTFTDTGAKHGLTAEGRPVVHEAAKLDFNGLVEFWPLEEPEEEDLSEPWDVPLDRPGGQSPMIRHARKIAATISGWLENGEMLPDGNPIRPGDILVLVRQRTKLMDAIIRAFKENNIPVAGADRMKLMEQLAVMDLVALAQFVLLPQDDLTLATVLKSPLIGYTEDQLFDLSYGRERQESLWQTLTKKASESDGPAREALVFLNRVMARADVLPTFEFFAALLEEERGRQKIVGRLGYQANDPLDEFLSLTLQYEQAAVPSLQGFLRWLDVHEVPIKRDMEQQRDEVRVMTVHGAKGLEAPIVFIPDMCTKPTGKSASLLDLDDVIVWSSPKDEDDDIVREARSQWDAVQKAEYHRLLYVGLTRAEDRLILSGHIGQKKGMMKDSWYELMSDVMQEHGEGETLEDERVVWRIGERGRQGQQGEVHRVHAAEQESLKLEHWALSPPPAEQVPPRPLMPSKPAWSEDVSRSPLLAAEIAQGDMTRYQRGNLVHGLLERLPEIEAVNREGAARRYLSRHAPDMSETDQAGLIADVVKVLNDPEFAPLFGPGSMAEAPLAGHVPELGDDVVLSARIDRLVVGESDILVVDYKSNRPPPATVEQVSDTYVWQMATYRAALRKLYPGKTVRCALLWIDVPRLMMLPDGIMDALVERKLKSSNVG